MWSRFGELARAQGADVATVLAFSETLWRWADAVMDVVGAAHREVELEQAREEQQRRDAFVFALLTGTLDPDELRRESATFGARPRARVLPVPRAGALQARRPVISRSTTTSPGSPRSDPTHRTV